MSIVGNLIRGTLKASWWGAKTVVPPAVRFGAPVAAGVAGAAAGATLSTARAAAHLALGHGYVAAKTMKWAAKAARLGVHLQDIEVFGRNLRVPTGFNAIGTSLVVGGGLALAAVGGYREAVANRRMDIDQMIRMGRLEVEDPRYLGATGSLGLAIYRNAPGRIRPGRRDGVGVAVSAAHVDDYLRLAVI